AADMATACAGPKRWSPPGRIARRIGCAPADYWKRDEHDGKNIVVRARRPCHYSKVAPVNGTDRRRRRRADWPRQLLADRNSDTAPAISRLPAASCLCGDGNPGVDRDRVCP